jgi:hypothetical protein
VVVGYNSTRFLKTEMLGSSPNVGDCQPALVSWFDRAAAVQLRSTRSRKVPTRDETSSRCTGEIRKPSVRRQISAGRRRPFGDVAQSQSTSYEW